MLAALWMAVAGTVTAAGKELYGVLLLDGEALYILFELGLPVHLVSYIEICAYHLAHPELSQWQVALHFNTHKYTVWRAYKLLN